MNLLCLETSAKAASVALFRDAELVGESYQNAGLTHSRTILLMAEQLLQQCDLSAAQVEALAVAAGPGSFTGVRIGMAAAKGFAWGRQLPLYGVSTLESMARGLGLAQGEICAVMDARRNQVYNARFYVNQGRLERLCPDRAIALEELKKELESAENSVFLVGDGSILCYNTLKGAVPALVLPPAHRMHQRAVGVGLAALAQIAAGVQPDAAALTPNYLRLSQAEREKAERERAKPSSAF
ncbi:MAG: tRNA (adenosine(37)-N6)-threonylcarbamoyltransferase complex dimerization subunit type 1 TsaB [Firmicutes bacterium]|nr:tRNA (adenosine(37)-N6)-threonylcarbamoyltransferase complex dimerization subunit type 1 TsaB [Bacillota bacterium]